MDRPTELHFPNLQKVDASPPPIGLESCQQFNHVGLDKFDSANWGVRRNHIVVVQYTLRGKGCVQFRDKVYEQRPGDCFHIHIKEPHRYWLPIDWEQWDFLSFTFDGSLALQLEDQVLKKTGPISHWSEESKLVQDMWALYDLITQQPSQNPFKVSASCYEIFMNILEGTSASRPASDLPRPVSLAIEFMEEHYMENPTLEEIAKVAELSPFHFNRLFKAHTGLTPRRHIEELRLQKAKRLLESPQLTLAQIASSCGYDEPAYFSTVFKRCFKMTPARYRKKAFLNSL